MSNNNNDLRRLSIIGQVILIFYVKFALHHILYTIEWRHTNKGEASMNKFVDYVMGFYGIGGIYDINATRDEVLLATGIRIERDKSISFDGDSLDREKVRDIILERRNECH